MMDGTANDRNFKARAENAMDFETDALFSVEIRDNADIIRVACSIVKKPQEKHLGT